MSASTVVTLWMFLSRARDSSWRSISGETSTAVTDWATSASISVSIPSPMPRSM